MKRSRKIVLAIIALMLLFVFVGMPYMKEQTKKHSPETTTAYNQDGYDLKVVYSSPSKKDRVIFGELVPYDVVWRTGANEPTTFTTGNDITINGKTLTAGTYSLWTKPSAKSWEVIFNSDVPEWGVTILSGGAKTTRDAEFDVATVTVPVQSLASPLENLTINFEKDNQLLLNLAWDKTKVSVPISK